MRKGHRTITATRHQEDYLSKLMIAKLGRTQSNVLHNKKSNKRRTHTMGATMINEWFCISVFSHTLRVCIAQLNTKQT